MKNYYTPEQRMTCCELLKEGYTATAIERMTGVNKNSVEKYRTGFVKKMEMRSDNDKKAVIANLRAIIQRYESPCIQSPSQPHSILAK